MLMGEIQDVGETAAGQHQQLCHDRLILYRVRRAGGIHHVTANLQRNSSIHRATYES
jgi:hypothetical protein